MKVGDGILTPATFSLNTTDARDGPLWHSLDVNPYALFERERLDRVVAKAAAMEARQLKIKGAIKAVLNLRLSIAGSESSKPIQLSTFICAETQLNAARADDCTVVLMTMEIRVPGDALLTRQMRTAEMPFGSASASGFLCPLSAKEVVMPMLESKTERKRQESEMAIFDKAHRGDGLAVYRHTLAGLPVLHAMLLRELRVKIAQMTEINAAIVKVAKEAAKKAAAAAAEEEEGSESESEGDQDSEDEFIERANADNIATLQSRRCNEIDWLRMTFEKGVCTVHIDYVGHYHWNIFTERSRRIVAMSYSDNRLRQTLFANENEHAFFITNLHRLNVIATAEPIARLPIPPPPPKPVYAVPAVLPPTRLIVPAGKLTWLDHFDTLNLNSITLYEWELYSRSRMSALMLLSKANDDAEKASVKKEAWNFWGLRQYPEHNGAKTHILQMIGAEAVQRRSLHQVIAMGFLALIARHNPQMRESLIYCELLWYRYQRSLTSAYSTTVEDEDEGMDSLCASFDAFWNRSDANVFNSQSQHIVACAQRIEKDWLFAITMPE